ncbi:MAG TPA: hypothetical protein VGF45_00305 [Polyangia bacterium]
MVRLVQFRDVDGRRAVAAATRGAAHKRLQDVETVYELVLEAIESSRALGDVVATYLGTETIDVGALEAAGRLLAPIEHPVPTRCWVTTGSGPELRFDEGPEVPSRWSFRGNGSTLVGAGAVLPMPAFARGVAPSPALAGLFVIAEDGAACQVGWALAHAVTDPVLLGGPGAGHASLRATGVGPELLVGGLPAELVGTARIRRAGATVTEHPVPLGEAAMTRPFEDLAREHFRYPIHRRPGDVHVHVFGTGQPSPPHPAAQPEDQLELAVPLFGQPLRNRLAIAEVPNPPLRNLWSKAAPA